MVEPADTREGRQAEAKHLELEKGEEGWVDFRGASEG